MPDVEIVQGRPGTFFDVYRDGVQVGGICAADTGWAVTIYPRNGARMLLEQYRTLALAEAAALAAAGDTVANTL